MFEICWIDVIPRNHFIQHFVIILVIVYVDSKLQVMIKGILISTHIV